MMQPLQGAVDVQAALRCSMSPDFAETATDRFTPATDGHPAVSKMQFVADLLIKLGVVQVSVLQVPAALASKVLLLDCRCSCAHTVRPGLGLHAHARIATQAAECCYSQQPTLKSLYAGRMSSGCDRRLRG